MSIIDDLMQETLANAAFKKLVNDETLSPGERLEKFMDSVDLNALYDDLKERRDQEGFEPNCADMFTVRCVEVYKPEIFKTKKSPTGVIAARNMGELVHELSKWLGEGKITAEAAIATLKIGAEEFGDTEEDARFNEHLLAKVAKGKISPEDAEGVRETIARFKAAPDDSFDAVSKAARELGERMGIPDEIIASTEKTMSELFGGLRKPSDKTDPTTN